jgi:hypothetical protein
MLTYQAKVKINDYQSVDTQVVAANDAAAKQILESMYGKGNVLWYSSGTTR